MNKPPATLLERTRELLMTRPRGVTLKNVADGSGLTFSFVHGISRGEMLDPGVTKVQKLYEYLAGKPLEY